MKYFIIIGAVKEKGADVQPPTYREIAAMLARDGFIRVDQAGSHAKYRKGSRVVTLAGSGGKRPPKGTWSSIRRQAGW